jgi:hypothetical protein
MLSSIRSVISRSLAHPWTCGAVAVLLLVFGVVGRASAQSSGVMAACSGRRHDEK